MNDDAAQRRRELSRRVVDSLRALYPQPEKAYEGGGYCVAGALGLMMSDFNPNSREIGFPGRSYIAMLLRQLNPALKIGKAAKFADRIIDSNDAGQFKQAWRHLEIALSWQPQAATVQPLRRRCHRRLRLVPLNRRLAVNGR